MKHLKEALEAVLPKNDYVTVGDNTVIFTIQDGPIKEVGINGCQASDMLEYVKELFVSLNNAYPCPENIDTISFLEGALERQADRTRDREKRGVEGKSEA